jgi:hypothetical protein
MKPKLAALSLIVTLAGWSSPAMAIFLSTDPVPPGYNNGTNFNRYSYANNNPYRFVDPDGRYVCESNAENCTYFDRGMTMAQAAAASPYLDASERAALHAVRTFFGDKGDPSVRISFKSNDLVQGTARLDADLRASISLIAGKDLWETVRDAFHEGSHGLDDRIRGRAIESRAERKATEVQAYLIQAIFQKATNRASNSNDGWTPAGGFRMDKIEVQAEGSVRAACLGETSGSCGP